MTPNEPIKQEFPTNEKYDELLQKELHIIHTIWDPFFDCWEAYHRRKGTEMRPAEADALAFISCFKTIYTDDATGKRMTRYSSPKPSIFDGLKKKEKRKRVDAIDAIAHGFTELGSISFEGLHMVSAYVNLGGDPGWMSYFQMREGQYKRPQKEQEKPQENSLEASTLISIITNKDKPIVERQSAASDLSDLGETSAPALLQKLLEREAALVSETGNGDQDNKVVRLAFEILPPDFLDMDEYYEHFDKTNELSRDNSSKERKERLKFVSNLGRHTKYIGSDEFGTKYLAFEFESHVIAECPLEGNAIYIIKGLTNWQNMLGHSKKELRSNYPSRVRKIIHKTDWQSRVKDAVNWPNV